MHANLAIPDMADKQKPMHEAAIMETASPNIIMFGFKDYVVDDGSKKRTVVCKVCSSKISDTATTTSNFNGHYKILKERYVNVSF